MSRDYRWDSSTRDLGISLRISLDITDKEYAHFLKVLNGFLAITEGGIREYREDRPAPSMTSFRKYARFLKEQHAKRK